MVKVNKKIKNQKQLSRKSFGRYLANNPKELLALIVLIALLVAPFIAWRAVVHKHHIRDQAIAVERAQFAQTEKDLNILLSYVTDRFGKPDDESKNKSCGYTSSFSEIKKGDLYCHIDISFVYGVQDRGSAKTLALGAEDFIKLLPLFKYTSASDALANTLPPEELLSASYTDVETKLDCSVGYLYFLTSNNIAAQGYANLKLQKANQGLLIELTCGVRPAKAEYYPVAN